MVTQPVRDRDGKVKPHQPEASLAASPSIGISVVVDLARARGSALRTSGDKVQPAQRVRTEARQVGPLAASTFGLALPRWRYKDHVKGRRGRDVCLTRRTFLFMLYGMNLPALLIIGTFSSCMVLALDVGVGYFFLKQLQSSNYKSTTGRIVYAKTIKNSSDEGTSYSPSFHYKYEVGERAYQGSGYRYLGRSFGDSERSAEIVRRYPVGSEVLVFYNPDTPGDSILVPGVSEQDGFPILLLIPFNVGVLSIWVAAAKKLRSLSQETEAGGLQVLRQVKEIRVRIARYSPLAHAMLATGCAGLLGAIICGLFASERTTSLVFPFSIFLITITIGIWYGYWQLRKQKSGNYDLLIDNYNECIYLPVTAKRSSQMRLNLKDVIAVIVEEHDDAQSEADPTYHNKLCLRRPAQSEELCNWLNLEKSSEFADWLSVQLGVPREPDRKVIRK